jgi:hypothetical protein
LNIPKLIGWLRPRHRNAIAVDLGSRLFRGVWVFRDVYEARDDSWKVCGLGEEN